MVKKEVNMGNQLKQFFYEILRIRMVEEEIALKYPQGKMRCPIHLSIGQEAVPVMISAHLKTSDLAVGTHRSHAHYLAKGGNLNSFIAELHGKATGCTQGRGGSMNLSDLKAGFVVSTAIVANTVPIGVGLAFSQQLKKNGGVSCIYLGDAAVEEGAVYESLNFAILKKLPVIFVCENNGYSVNTPIRLRQPANRSIYEMMRGIGAKTQKLNGNDVANSFASVTKIMHDLRENGGAWFVEFETYRYRVHCGPEEDTNTGRPQAEFDYWLARDPLLLLQGNLLKTGAMSLDDVKKMRVKIQTEIDQAFNFAEQSPFPKAEDRFLYKYADSREEWLSTILHKQSEGMPA